MTIAEAVSNLAQLNTWLDECQSKHPEAVVVVGKKNGCFSIKAYERHPRSISFAEARQSIEETKTLIEKLGIEHPQASISPTISKKRFSIFAVINARITGFSTRRYDSLGDSVPEVLHETDVIGKANS